MTNFVNIRSGASDGALQFNGNDQLVIDQGNVTVTGNATVNANLSVTGSGEFTGNLTLGGAQVLTSVSGGLGYGQTWQNVAGSRAMNIGYVNTTGKPIIVSASGGTAAYTTPWQVIVNAGSGNVVISNAVLNPNDASATIQGVIPPGNTYYLTGGGTIDYWAELR